MPETEQLSKKAQKKALRLEKLKAQNKANRKLKKQLAKDKKKELTSKSGQSTASENHVSKKTLKLQTIEKLQNVLKDDASSRPKICIDLQYEELMSEKELIHLAQQLSRVYGFNRKSSDPCHLTFCHLPKDCKTRQICCDKSEGFANYILNFSEKSLIDTFENRKQDLVYLTPDSDNLLEDIEDNKIYVIGGLVDDSVKKLSSLSFAKDQGLTTAKLPIDKYCSRIEGSFKQILTINQVFEILLNKIQGFSWPQVFSQSLPSRIGFQSQEGFASPVVEASSENGET